MAALIDSHPGSRRLGTIGLLIACALVAVTTLATVALHPGSAIIRAAARSDVRITADAPQSLDPAAEGDIASASVSAQLYESLTAFDGSLVLRPALASSWDISADGRRVVFHLRPGITFSDGTPIGAADVVGSWLRLIDHAAPSPLSSLILGVHGSADFLAGRTSDPATVGLHAEGSDVVVDLDRPGADFPAIVAGPSFGVVPPTVWRDHGSISDPKADVNVVVSGGYLVSAISTTEITLSANPRYWAGQPAIATVHLLTDLGGISAVAAFQAGDVDYIEIGNGDATWVKYDKSLGSELRVVPELGLAYLGFDTSRPPFNDVRVRRAFGAAVDWKRIVALDEFGGVIPATSMVPPGVPGGSATDWLPTHDPALARQLLAQAGYPSGSGFPTISFATGNIAYSSGIAADLRRELGITVQLENLEDHFARLAADPPPMWALGWVADYPGANDFLGVLLGTGSANDYGRWSSAPFDRAIDQALATRDPAAAQMAFEAALAIVQHDVPVVPLSYGDSWALSRTGLLGAGQNGLGILRIAGLAWKAG